MVLVTNISDGNKLKTHFIWHQNGRPFRNFRIYQIGRILTDRIFVSGASRRKGFGEVNKPRNTHNKIEQDDRWQIIFLEPGKEMGGFGYIFKNSAPLKME